MKRSLLYLIIGTLLLLNSSACEGKQTTPLKPMSTGLEQSLTTSLPTFMSTKTSVLNTESAAQPNSALSAQVFRLQGDDYFTYPVLSREDDFLYYTKTAKLSELEKQPVIKAFNIPDSYRLKTIWHIDDDGTMYYYTDALDGMRPSLSRCKLGQENSSEHLFRLEQGHVAGFASKNQDYLIWYEAANLYWKEVKLHLLNLRNGKDQIIHHYRTHEEGEDPMQTALFASVVVLNDKVYFSEREVSDEKKDLKLNVLLCYDIQSGSTTTVKKNALFPLLLDGEVCCFEPAEKPLTHFDFSMAERHYKLIVDQDQSFSVSASLDGKGLLIFDALNIPQHDQIFEGKILDEYTDKDRDTIVAHGLRIILNGTVQPILASSQGFGHVKANRHALTWDAQYACYFDLHTNTLVRLDQLPHDLSLNETTFYATLVSENSIFYRFYDRGSGDSSRLVWLDFS